VLVGIPSNEDGRSDGNLGNAAIGYIHEKGSPAQNIPARPFLEPGVKAASARVVDIFKEGASASFSDPSAGLKALNKAGLVAQAEIKKALVAGEGFAPLSKSTLDSRRRRGVTRSKPLIDTGSLLASINYVVK